MNIIYPSPAGGLPDVGRLLSSRLPNISTARRIAAIAAAGTSYTLEETFGTDASDGSNIGDSANRVYVSSQVTAANTYTLTKLALRLRRVDGGGSAANLVGEIYDENTGAPGTLLAESTNTITSAQVGTTMQWVDFLFAGLSITSTTIYWLGLRCSGADASNYYVFRGGAISSGSVSSSSNGLTWSALSTRKWYQQTFVSP